MQSNEFNYLFLDKDIISLVWNKYLAAALKRNASFEYFLCFQKNSINVFLVGANL